MKKYLNRLVLLDKIIREGNTGNSIKISRRLGTSEWVIYDCIRAMKHFGARIKFNKKIKSYVYERPGLFNFNFQEKVEEIEKTTYC